MEFTCYACDSDGREVWPDYVGAIARCPYCKVDLATIVAEYRQADYTVAVLAYAVCDTLATALGTPVARELAAEAWNDGHPDELDPEVLAGIESELRFAADGYLVYDDGEAGYTTIYRVA